MKELRVKHLFDGLVHLDTINLEEKLNSSPNIQLFSENVFFDLSKCQFAELGALTQLVLTIESFVKSNHRVFIALPTIILTTNQEKNTTDSQWSEKSLKQQILANNFIKKTGFIRILQEISKEYQSEIYFTETYDYVKKGQKIDFDSFTNTFSEVYDEITLNEANYKFLFPFKLIYCEKGVDQIKDFEDSLDKILLNKERGLESFDVKVIKNVILSELIKNVKVHSKSKYAVFAVGLINSNSILSKRRFKKFNPIEENYLKYLIKNNIESQVEIYFGDCGIGLLNDQYKQITSIDFGINKTNSKRILELAFNKWSTTQDNEPRRGTKGLYRLKRIVDKYKGMVHIKTIESNGGFFNGGFEYRNMRSNFKGTLISLKLNPFKELKTFKLSNDNTPSELPWISEKIIVNEDLNCIQKIRDKVLHGSNLLLISDITNINLSSETKLFENFLYEISYLSHPSAIVIYLINNIQRIDNDTLELIVESVQTRINLLNNEVVSPENENPDFEEVHDPVLLIGNNNQTFWYGGSNKLIKIIDESFLKISTNESIVLNKLLSFLELSENEKIEIKNYLETDSNLVVLNKNQEIIFNFYGLENHYENKIKKFKPKSKDKIICTPKLNIINSWIDIKDLLKDDEYGFALCLYLKYRRIYEFTKGDISNLDKTKTFILIDHTQQVDLTKKFAELLGLKYKNIRNIEDEIDYSMPKRTKLFNDSSNVIFLTTIVSSSETIRRMVKYAKRDKAYPDLILCLINYRTNKINKLETWNETTDIISVFQKFNIESNSIKRDDNYLKKKLNELKTAETYISPNFSIENEDNSIKSIKVDAGILSFLKNNKFLHYNHYGHNNKRHFTFYLDKNGIINSNEKLIVEKLNTTISNWVKLKNINNFTLYINSSFVQNASNFLKYLEENFKDKYKLIDVKYSTLNNKNSIYLDFGILTGSSINNLINKIDNVDNLLICLLFNQSINSNANIFKKINTLKIDLPKTLIPIEKDSEVKAVDFEIQYLFDLPLSFFNSENCPICEHRRALNEYTLKHTYLEKFSNDRLERLKQNSIEDINDLSYPVDFYFSDKEEEKKQELSKDIIFQMYEFKILFENALASTKHRIELYETIFNLYSRLDEEIKISESKIYSLVYFLSHEINWLQREPLVFRDFRIVISKIAHKISITNLDHLKAQFDLSNNYDIPSKNLATRYKYSAISVLRSADKLMFCQSLYEIIKSSFTQENRFSDNLLQNTLYHIASFYKNEYNKNEIYFLEIEINLSKISEEYTVPNTFQSNAIQFIRKKNKEVLLDFRKLEDEPKAFKEMKDKWEKLYYTEMPKHPEPYQEFKSLQSIEQHKGTLAAIKINPNLTDEIKLLNKLIQEMPNRLSNVRHYLTNNITHYLSEKLPILSSSDYFGDEFSNSLNIKSLTTKIERVQEILNFIQADLNNYEIIGEELNQLCGFLSDSIFIKRNLENSSNDSKFIGLISDFPLNLSPCILEVFSEGEFQEIKQYYFYKDVELNDDAKFKAYFPISIFKRHLENIKNNILQKLNIGADLKSTKINFTIIASDDQYLVLKLSYNNTDKWFAKPNENGSLSTLKKHIESFNGSFKYGLIGNNFELEFKFLRYD
jgi:hypothetical protein